MARLSDLFDPELINLNLKSASRDDVITGLASMLDIAPGPVKILSKRLLKLQDQGSTGFGHGMALVYIRSLVVATLHVGFGRQPRGIDFGAIDNKPVYYFFFMVAPPVIPGMPRPNVYLPIMTILTGVAMKPDMPELLANVETPEGFLRLMDAESHDLESWVQFSKGR